MTPPRLILAGGGCRSGKSRFALSLARGLGPRKLFLATALPGDAEMSARIGQHRLERGGAFVTVEEPLALPEVVRRQSDYDVLVLDCLTLWLANLLLEGQTPAEIADRLDDLVAAFAAAGTALAASNSLRVKVTKKQLAFTGTAAAASDSVEVHFDPNKCATSYARETKRKRVAFTDFQVRRARHFTFTVKVPIPAPQGDKPGHHACAYLLHVSGASIKPVASASAKY